MIETIVISATTTVVVIVLLVLAIVGVFKWNRRQRDRQRAAIASEIEQCPAGHCSLHGVVHDAP